MPISAVLTEFRSSVSIYNGYISKAFTQGVTGLYILPESERSCVVESVFLKMFISWETFLEEVFVYYLMGNASASGRVPTKFASPTSESHAKEMITGTQKYIDWANPEIIRKLAKLYFDNGEPIGRVLSSIQSDLFDLKTIRNAAAHLTTTTKTSLEALAARKLNRSCSGIDVSTFVLSLDPRGNGTSTILDNYLILLDTAAHEIAHWA